MNFHNPILVCTSGGRSQAYMPTCLSREDVKRFLTEFGQKGWKTENLLVSRKERSIPKGAVIIGYPQGDYEQVIAAFGRYIEDRGLKASATTQRRQTHGPHGSVRPLPRLPSPFRA